MLQILLRITEAVMQKPKESQAKDTFAQGMAGLLFRVSDWGCLLCFVTAATALVEYCESCLHSCEGGVSRVLPVIIL